MARGPGCERLAPGGCRGRHARRARPDPEAAEDRAIDHADHVALIRAGVEGAGPRWLELGAGTGEFTLALSDVLGPGGDVVALDLDAAALRKLEARLAARFPATRVRTVVGDLRAPLPAGTFDGILAANSLHFIADLQPVLQMLRAALGDAGRLVVVEYDADRGNPWVPHPFSSARWSVLARQAGFEEPALIHRVPSRFLGGIYGAVTRPSRDGAGHW